MKQIALLGSTGSIGKSTLEVVAEHPDAFRIVALAAGSNVNLLAQQVRRFRPEAVSVASAEAAAELSGLLGKEAPEIVYGEEGLKQVATHPSANFVLSAVVGSSGIAPTMAAIEAGKAIGLANKETLVAAGHLVMGAARAKGVPIIPVDSEHSAIFQCLQAGRREEVARLILTASGGAFRHLSRSELTRVTVKEAMNHPNWNMGTKVTIDSATMMNKGLEVIEAHWLFGMPYEQIACILHYESIVHSMVEYKDRAVIAQLGTPDMKVPIQYALSFPERMPLATEPLDLTRLASLRFAELDFARYPLLKLAYECGKTGGTMPTVLNAANEIAVARFVRGEIGFLDIERVVEQVCQAHEPVADPDLEAIWEADAWARRLAGES